MSAQAQEQLSNLKEQGPAWRLALIASSCALMSIYAASSAPIPLYADYSLALGLSSGDLSMSAVAYFVGTLLALLFCARLSNFLGRKPLAFTALLLAILGVLAFCNINSFGTLFVGRLLQGFSCGLASSAIAAYIMDTAPTYPVWLGSSLLSASPMLGLGLGAFASGLLKQYLPAWPNMVFVIILLLLLFCALMFCFSAESLSRQKGALASLAPEVYIPPAAKRFLPAATTTFIATWAIGGMYQAFSASMASEYLGSSNTVMGAAVFASLMLPNLLGSSISGRFCARQAQLAGILLFALFLAGAVGSLHLGFRLGFFAASIGAGLAWGAAFNGAMRSLLQGVEQAGRAGVLSAIFLLSYGGAAVPNLIVGRVAGYFSLSELTLAYLCLSVCLALLTCILAPKKELCRGA